MSTTVLRRPLLPPSGREHVQGRARSLVRGRADEPSWARPALVALLIVTAVAYVWDLSASGYANSFYAAAVQAATKSWKALFFGSLDASSFITVDKPPASLWVMALSGRIFGFSSTSMLVPQALEGVAAVALLYAGVKRWFGPGGRSDGGSVAGDHAGGGVDVPLQQPRRAAGDVVGRSRLLPGPGPGGRVDALGGGGRDDDRVGVPGQDDAGVPGPARVRFGLPGRSPHRAAPPHSATPRGRTGDRGQRRLVGRDRGAVAGGFAADDRWVAEQQHLQPDHGLQRAGADLRRQRGGGRRRRGIELQRPHRSAAAVQRSDGRSGVLAAAGRAGGAGGGALVHSPRSPNRPYPCGAAAVGWMARRQRPGVQLEQRDHPHLLHGRAGARDRGAGGDPRVRAVARAPDDPLPGIAGGRSAAYRRLVMGAARPHPAVGVVAARGDRGERRSGRDRLARGLAAAAAGARSHHRSRLRLLSSPAWPGPPPTPPRPSPPPTPDRLSRPGRAPALGALDPAPAAVVPLAPARSAVASRSPAGLW